MIAPAETESKCQRDLVNWFMIKNRYSNRTALAHTGDILKCLILALLLPSFASAETLCVATYNLNFANRHGDLVLDAIAVSNADVICFQESTVESEAFLRKRLASTHPHFYAVGHRGLYFAERFAFASRIELKDVVFTPPDAGLFGFLTATINYAGQPVRIVNVHLSPIQIAKDSGLSDVLAALSRSEEKRSIEIDTIVKNMDVKLPTIVLGDFNSISTFDAPKRLHDLGMIDAFAAINENADTFPTWRWPTRPIPLALRIDYIFHSSHFTTTKSAAVWREGSDHALVYASLSMKD